MSDAANISEGISIRAPNERSDFVYACLSNNCHIFQSALPMKGATKSEKILHIVHAFQSALPMKGATRRG